LLVGALLFSEKRGKVYTFGYVSPSITNAQEYVLLTLNH
jgi:hypothetical protein